MVVVGSWAPDPTDPAFVAGVPKWVHLGKDEADRWGDVSGVVTALVARSQVIVIKHNHKTH